MFHLLGNFLPPRKYYNRWWKALDTNQCQIQKIHVFTKRATTKNQKKIGKKKRKKDEKHFSRHLKYNWPWLKEFPQNYHTSQKKKKNTREKIEIEDLREKNNTYRKGILNTDVGGVITWSSEERSFFVHVSLEQKVAMLQRPWIGCGAIHHIFLLVLHTHGGKNNRGVGAALCWCGK